MASNATPDSKQVKENKLEFQDVEKTPEEKQFEVSQLKDLFELYDRDNSGTISKQELKLLMNSLEGFLIWRVIL